MGDRTARPILGLIAGTFVVLLLDRFFLPGTLVYGFIGVLSASAVLALTNRNA